MKRIFDIVFALFVLTFAAPVLGLFCLLVFLQDFHNPLYIPPRVGRNGKLFRMVKIRSMIVNADKSGVDSTSADDKRITIVGKLIRKFKLDELTQFWNVLLGHMSVVGPRPNVEREVSLYTEEERKLLEVRPGITDLSSIVFSDEGDILEGSENPDLLYNQVIRPWKSRLALINVRHQTLCTNAYIIILTGLAIISRGLALGAVSRLLTKWDADEVLIRMATRTEPLVPCSPPGAKDIVQSRSGGSVHGGAPEKMGR